MKRLSCAFAVVGCALIVCLLAGPSVLANDGGGITLTDRIPAAAKNLPLRTLHPNSDPTGSTDDILDRADLENSVRSIYDRFVEASRLSGDDVSFEINDFTTYRRGQFDEIQWIDLFSLPSGNVIETVPYERLGNLPSQSMVHFRSSWQQSDQQFRIASDFTKATASLRASDALQQLAEWQPQVLRGIAALSSYQVKVDFEGQSRTYRAMVLWRPLSNDTLFFTLADHVVSGVSLTFGEDRQVVSREVFDGVNDLEGPQEKLGCYSSSTDTYGPTLTTNTITLGHSSGGHSGTLRVGRHCTTNVACTSSCSPYAANQNCAEFGSISNILYWHKKANSVALSSIDGYNGAPSQCGYALGCAVKDCLLGIFCGGISFGLSGSGASITLHASGSVLTDMSLNHGGGCPGAVQIEPPCVGCCDEVTTVAVLDLQDSGGPLVLPSDKIALRRLEESPAMHHSEPVRYLMEEWALVSYNADLDKAMSPARIMAHSTYGLDSAVVDGLSNALSAEARTKGATTGERMALLVALPPHEANSRKIEMPRLQVASGPLPMKATPGKVLVRADFSDDHQLQGLQILHDSVGGVSRELALYLEKALSLQRFTDEEHRVVAFALLSVGDAVTVDDSIIFLPKCCCGAEFCV